LSAFNNDFPVDADCNLDALRWLCGFGVGNDGNGINGDDYDVRYGGILPSLVGIYGEELIDSLCVARIKVIQNMTRYPLLPRLGDDSEFVVEGVFGRLGEIGEKMSLELQNRLMARIENSCKEGGTNNDDRIEDDAVGGGSPGGEEDGAVEGAAAEKGGDDSEFATVEDIRNACQCLLFRSSFSFAQGLFGAARKLATATLGLMTRCSDPAVKLRQSETTRGKNDTIVSFDARMWMECRTRLAEVAVSQGRLEEGGKICVRAIKEGELVEELVWSRRLKLLRIEGLIQEGGVTAGGAKIGEAESEARGLIREYLESYGTLSPDYVRALLTLSYILQQRAISEEDVFRASLYFGETRKLLVEAEKKMLEVAAEVGWVGNCPLMYDDIRSNEMVSDLKPPNETALRATTPEVEFRAKVDDEGDAVSPSPLSNLYFESVRLLAIVRLYIARNLSETVPQREVEGDSDGFEESDAEGATDEILSRIQLDEVALRKCELALATLRNVNHPHPVIRAEILGLCGEMRMLHCQRMAKGGKEAEKKKKAEFEAASESLLGCLKVSFDTAGMDRVLMRKACLNLANLYGNTTLGGGADVVDVEENHSKIAIYFLMLGCEIVNAHQKLFLGISEFDDGTFSATGMGLIPRSVKLDLGGAENASAHNILHHFLALIREKDGRSLRFEMHSRICELHALMFAEFPGYRNGVCVERERLLMPKAGGGDGADDEENNGEVDVSVNAGLCCVQWVRCAKEDDFVDRNDPDNVGADLHPWVKMMLLVGCGEGGGEGRLSERFGEEVGPLLVVGGEVIVRSREVREMRSRASEMRAALEHYHILKGEDNLEAPLGLQRRFWVFIRDMLALICDGKSLPLAEDGELGLTDSLGNAIDLSITVDNLMLLENFFDLTYGLSQQSIEFAYLLRDNFDAAASSALSERK